MQALRITEPFNTQLVEIDEPVCGVGDVLLRVLRVGYCGSDLNTFRGFNPLVSYPRIPGHELAGEIVAVGERVEAGFEVGEIVTGFPYTECNKCTACKQNRPNCCRSNQTLGVQRDGALSEFVALPWQSVIRASNLDPQELTLIEPLSVGFHAVSRGRVSSDDIVCVIGCGMIGLGAIARSSIVENARVIAVDIHDNKLELARKVGASDTINPTQVDLHKSLQELTSGNGPDVMIEAVGSVATFLSCVEEVSFGGRVVYIGYAKQPVSYDTKYFVLKELDIYGSRNASRADFDAVIALLQGDRYPVTETITRAVPMKDAASALHEWADAPESITKIHVEVGAIDD